MSKQDSFASILADSAIVLKDSGRFSFIVGSLRHIYLKKDIDMLSRRAKPFGPTVLFIALLLIAGYGYYLYNEQYSKFVESKGKLVLVKKKQLSLKSQLQGRQELNGPIRLILFTYFACIRHICSCA